MKKSVSRTAVILYAVCALIWTVRVVLEVAYKIYNDSIFWFIMTVLCTAFWIAAFIVNLQRYRSDK